MKLGTKFLATVCASALMVVGFAVPAANAESGGGSSGSDKTCDDLTAGLGYEAKVDTKGDPKSVEYTAPFGYLVDKYCVKAGSVNQDDEDTPEVEGGPEIRDVSNKKTVTISHTNGKAVSHYAVLLVKDNDWKYPAPTCKALTVTWPEGIKGNDVKIRTYLNGNVVFELLWKADENQSSVDNGSDNWSPSKGNYYGTVTFTYSGHANYPANAHFTSAWIQVDGTNYHWQGSITCGEPVKEYVCKWDAENDKEVKVAKNGANDTRPAWGEGCTPPMKEYCFKVGDGDYQLLTVYKDGEYQHKKVDKDKCYTPPPVDKCDNLDGNQGEVPAGWTVKDGYCFTYAYVCWQIDNPVDNFPGGLPVFPQTFVYEGDSFKDAYDYCADFQAECDEVLQFQVDKYKIDSFSDEKLLADLIENGLYGGHRGEGGDGKIYAGFHKFIEIAGDDCPPPPPTKVNICVFNDQTGLPESVEIDEADLKDSDILWSESNNGLACTPTVDLCINWIKVSDVPVTDPRVDKYDEWSAKTCTLKDSGKIDICHATESENGNGTGWVYINVSWNAVWNPNNGQWHLDLLDGNGHGNDGHQEGADVIPAFVLGEGTPYAYPYPGKNLGDGGEAFLEAECDLPVEVCWYNDDSGAYEMGTVPESLYDPKVHTMWTGDARDCFDVKGSVDICHYTEEGDDPLSALTVKWRATWNGEAGEWEFSFAGSHGDEGMDVIPPFGGTKYGVEYGYPGMNFPEAWTGEGWDAWIEYWENDCAVPVEPTKIATPTELSCEVLTGAITYKATVGTGHENLAFYFEKVGSGEGPELIGTFNPGDMVDFTRDGLAPGTYRVYASSTPELVEFFPVALVSQLVEVDPYAFYEYETTLEAPDTECADIDPSTIDAQCKIGTPVLNYNVVLNDPFSEVSPEQIIISFSDGSNSWTSDPIPVTGFGPWAGEMFWPGYAEDESGNAISFPGWILEDDGSWTPTDDPAYLGWTRNAATITISLNPTTDITGVVYPAESEACVPTQPDDEVDDEEEEEIEDRVLGAPPLEPAVPVRGAVTYAG